MKIQILSGIALLALAGSTAVVAQPNGRPGYDQSRGWDAQAFWRNAPNDPRQRIDYLQRRIDRGIADGSLDRREGRRSLRELNDIRRDAARMGRLDSRERAMLQDRLDNLSRTVRWERRDGDTAYRGAYNGDRVDPRFATTYDASRYYRDGDRYQERRLTSQDEVYRGSDGRYYCKRSDGTTGLVIGAVGGAVLGNVIDGGHQRAAGTLLGGVLGALVGKSVDQNSDVRCK